MSALPWPDHLLSLEEWDELPEDTSRHYELVEGILVAAPLRGPLHATARVNLAVDLNLRLPDSLRAVPNVDVVIESSPHPALLGHRPATISTPLHVHIGREQVRGGRAGNRSCHPVRARRSPWT